MKGNKGITLIALIITIIVLLILSGVAIKTITGYDSIPDNAKLAVETYKTNAEKEQQKMQGIIDYVKHALAGETETFDETVGYSGTGTAEDPYLIESIEDLVKFSNEVKEGEEFEGKVFKLAQNLDFENPKSYIDATRTDLVSGTELLTAMTTGTGFYPIGQKNNPFSGTFDGQGHSIYNLHQSQNISNLGLFGYVYNGTVKNISVTGNVSAEGANDTYQVGGVIGQMIADTDVVIENCSFNGTVKGFSKVGNVVGLVDTDYNVNIKNCTAMGNVDGTTQIGGVAGVVQGNKLTMKDCINRAKITISGNARAGGIVSYTSVGEIDVSNCHNSGEISSTAGNSNEIAGIIGQSSMNDGEGAATVTIKNCTNSGVIKGDKHSGGIMGELGSGRNLVLTMSDNRNEANIISTTVSTDYGVAGIIGHAASDVNLTANINNCVNKGNVSGEINALAGIIGDTWTTGATTLNLLNCLNTGNIGTTTTTARQQFAGLIGGISTSSSSDLNSIITATIKNCVNTGAVGPEQNPLPYMAGLIGALWSGEATGSTLAISNCVNVGTVLGDSEDGIGGIVGGINSKVTPTITNAFYLENPLFATVEADGDMLGAKKTAAELRATGTGSVLQTLDTEAAAHASDTIPYLRWKQNSSSYPVINI